MWYLPKPGSADLLQPGSAGQRGRCPGHERRQATRPDPLETPLLIITRILIDLVINVGVRISPPGERRCHAVRRTRHRVGAGARARTLLSSLMSLLPRPGRCTPASPDASSEPASAADLPSTTHRQVSTRSLGCQESSSRLIHLPFPPTPPSGSTSASSRCTSAPTTLQRSSSSDSPGQSATQRTPRTSVPILAYDPGDSPEAADPPRAQESHSTSTLSQSSAPSWTTRGIPCSYRCS